MRRERTQKKKIDKGPHNDYHAGKSKSLFTKKTLGGAGSIFAENLVSVRKELAWQEEKGKA